MGKEEERRGSGQGAGAPREQEARSDAAWEPGWDVISRVGNSLLIYLGLQTWAENTLGFWAFIQSSALSVNRQPEPN